MSANLDFLDPFRTTEFGYDVDSFTDIELQPFYDGSVNIITAVEDTLPRIVNSRQKFHETEVELVVRKADNLDNVYSNTSIDKTILVPRLGETTPELEFNNVNPNSGKILNGGYKYYFRLKTADGIESAIIEESRLVSIHEGTEYGKTTSYIEDTFTNNSVQFTLSNIDTKVYTYVSVYYVRATGQTSTTVKTAYHIDKDYEIEITSGTIGKCEIVHTGFEGETLIDIADITIDYSPIDSVGALSTKNNRLLLGNIKAISTTNELLQLSALKCFVEEEPDSYLYTEQKVYEGDATIDDTYASPRNIYYKLGYFPGETYEFAVNFVYKNGSVSAAYPIMGMDYDQGGTFDQGVLGQDIGWVDLPNSNYTQNSSGVVRMKDKTIQSSFVEPIGSGSSLSKMEAWSMHIDTTKMVTEDAGVLKDLGIVSYFISRKHRIPDIIMEGLITPAATAPISSMHPTELNTYMFGMNTGYGLSGSMSGNMVLFPLPGNAMPVSSEGLDANSTEKSYYYFDGILYAPLADKDNNKYYAFYSPDVVCDTSTSSLLSNKKDYGIELEAKLTQNIAYTTSKLLSHWTTVNDTRYAYCANPYRFTGSTLSYNVDNMHYVDDGVRAFSSLNFTGRLDRQAALALYSVMKSYADWGNSTDRCTIIYRVEQYNFSAAKLLNDLDTWYTSHRRMASSPNPGMICGSTFPWDSTDAPPQVPMTGVKYSPYLGLTIENSTSLTDALIIPETGGEQGFFTAYELESYMLPSKGENTIMGAIARIYTNSYGRLTASDWFNKYSISRGDNYFAVSNRFSIDYGVHKSIRWQDSFLTGGDCYSSIFYQRVWRPGEIDGIPTANNPRNYSEVDGVVTREGVNITNSGYAIGFPVRSKYNFALRALEKVDDAELALYGEHRTYTSAYPEEETHGNRQPETAVINYGNMQEESVLQYGGYDPSIPYIELEYPNRVVTSEISVTGEFENGYRDFKGLNFKDYDEEKGDIIAMVPHGLYTYVIYKNGVSLIEISERSAVTDQSTGTNVYTASADVLPPKSTPIFENIGSQHIKSVITTEPGIFGVDADSKKIWKVNTKEKKVISDMTIQTILNQLITNNLKNVITSYDIMFDEVTFTFIYNDDSQKSILYNTTSDIWCGTTDIHKIYQFNVEEKMLSLQKPENSSVYNMYFPVVNTTESSLFEEVGKTTAIDDRELLTKSIYNSYIEFVVKSDQLNKFDLSNLIINGTGIPSSIDIIAESLEEYTVDVADPSISGMNQHTLPTHTNIFMQDADALNLQYIDEYRFKRFRSSNFKTLAIGDRITLDLDGTLQQLRIANITFNSGDNSDIVVVSNPMANITMTRLYYGWKIPMRLSLGEVMGGKVKFTIPSKKHANLLKGVSATEQNYHVNYSNAKPYGRWVKLRLNFDGIDQIFIESIMSEITLRYS